MARVVFTAQADADVADILDDLALRAGARVLARYEANFDRLYTRLEQWPDSGAPRPRIGEHVRIAVVAPYVVVYEHPAEDDLVTVMRVIHGRRDLAGRS